MKKQARAHLVSLANLRVRHLTKRSNRMAQYAELRKEIAGRLKQARENAGYKSAQDFCEANQLSYTDYLSYESGSKSIKISKAKSYAKLLNVSLMWLLVGDLNAYTNRGD